MRVLIHFALPDTHTGGETAIRAITEKEEEEEEEKTDVAQLCMAIMLFKTPLISPLNRTGQEEEEERMDG